MICPMKVKLLSLALACLSLTSCESPSSGDRPVSPSYTYVETGWHHGWGSPRVLRGARGLH